MSPLHSPKQLNERQLYTMGLWHSYAKPTVLGLPPISSGQAKHEQSMGTASDSVSPRFLTVESHVHSPR